MSDDDLDLNALNDDELVEQMGDDLYDGLKEEIEESTRILLDRGWTPYDVLTKSLVAGMTVVGEDFRDGILYVPEVLMAANAMNAMTLFSATRDMDRSVTGPRAPSSCATWISTAGDEEIATVAITAAGRPSMPSHPRLTYTTAKVSALSHSAIATSDLS